MDDKELQKVTKSIRNRTKAWADKIVVSQYTGAPVKREEGERWFDHDGKEWEMKNGIAQSVSKLQSAKTPWWCPSCEKTMTKLDTEAWRVHAKCLDCVAKWEGQLKREGKWDIERKKGELRNVIAYLNDRLIELTYYEAYLSDNIELQHYDDKTGNLLMIDKYTVDTNKLKEQLRKDAVAVNKNITRLESELAELEAETKEDED